MTLGDGFRHAGRLGLPQAVDNPVEKGLGGKIARHVRTSRGAKVFGQPIGTLITRDMVERARREGRLAGGGERPGGGGVPGRKYPRLGAAPQRARRAAANAVPKAHKAPAKGTSHAKALNAAKDRQQVADIMARVAADTSLSPEYKASLARDAKKLDQWMQKKGLPAPKRPAKKTTEKPAAKKAATRAPAAKKTAAPAPESPPMGLARPPKAPAKAPPAAKKAIPPPSRRGPAQRGPSIQPKGSNSERTAALIERAKKAGGDRAALGQVERDLADDQMLTSSQRHAVKTAIADARGSGKVPEGELPQRGGAMAAQQRSFQGHWDKIGALASDVANNRVTPEGAQRRHRMLEEEIKTDPTLTAALRGSLRSSLNDAVSMRAPRSSRYGSVAEDIRHVETRFEAKTLMNDFIGDTTMSVEERKSLLRQLQEQVKGHRIDWASVLSNGVDFEDPTIGEDWDSHPDKVKPSTPLDLGGRSKYLHDVRTELHAKARQIRISESQLGWATPAGKEIAKGTPLDQVKDVTGMQAVIAENPDRFAKVHAKGGQGVAFAVLDHDTGRKYFFKETLNGNKNQRGNAVAMHGEAANEVMSGQIGAQAFPEMFPNVDFGGTLTEGVTPVIRMDHMDEFAQKGAPGDVRKVNYESEHRWDVPPDDYRPDAFMRSDAKKVRDPDNPLAIHIFDYLTNNTDRHAKNYSEVTHNDGTVTLVPLDNGAAFSAFDTFWQTQIPGHMVSAPENVGYAEWGLFYTGDKEFHQRPRFMAVEAKKAADDHGRSEEDTAKAADAIIRRFSQMSPEQIIAELRKRFPNMPDYEAAHMEKAAQIFSTRVRNISGRDVAKVLSRMYYEPTTGMFTR